MFKKFTFTLIAFLTTVCVTAQTYKGSVTETKQYADKDYPYTVAYSITYNADKSLSIDASFEWGNEGAIVGTVAPLKVYIQQINEFNNMEGFKGAVNYAGPFEKDAELSIEIFVECAAGRVGPTLKYKVGSVNNEEGGEDPGENPGGGDEEDPEQPDVPGTGVTFVGEVEDSDTLGDAVYPYTLHYTVTYNEDHTLTVTGEIEWGANGEYPGATNLMAYFPDGNFEGNMKNGPYKTEKTYEYGQEVQINFWIARQGGRTETHIIYEVGSINDNSKTIKLTASVDNITFNSAEISYDVTAPEGAEYKVYYRTADNDAVEATENPIKLTDLTESTEYTYELYAQMTVEDETIESRPVTVTFKTPVENAVKHVFYDYLKAEFKNAYRIGEDESSRRSIFISLPFTITYDLDETVTYAIDLAEVADIVGLVPQIYWNGHRTLTKQDGSDIYTYNFGVQPLEEKAEFSHYLAYNGGTVDVNLYSNKVYTAWGQEKEAFDLGDATDIALAASKTYVKVNEPIILSAVPTDAQGYYLPADDMAITVAGGPYTLDGVVLTLIDFKGDRTVTASMGEISKSIIVTALTSNEAEDIISGAIGYTDEENIMENTTVESVTDNNPNTELRWSCQNTQEHYLIYDLSTGHHIEAIDLLFEGAYATKFTVTLTNNKPAEIGGSDISTLDATPADDVVFEPAQIGTQHYFTQDPAGTHQYVVLRTTEALNTGWGIKVKDMKVYGTVAPPTTTGVETVVVEDENAPVEYYNMQGVRVNNPANGIYIRRQGNTATKVLVR